MNSFVRLVQRRKHWIALGLLGAVVLLAFYPALQLSFVGDDWIFYELAGRLSLPDYLVKYFDPRVQTAWYRPVQGVLFRIGYDVFGTNQVGYHLVNVLIHLANAALVYLLTARATGKWRVALTAGLLFGTFPIAVEGIFKTGVIDPVTTLASLGGLWFWLSYLEKERARAYVLAFGCFMVALLSKEIAVTLPVTLFLFDRLLVRKPISLVQLVRRYAAFVMVWIAYLPLEYLVVTRSVFVHREGYQASLNLFGNLVGYLAGLAFPWGFAAPLSYVWLAVVTLIFGYLVLVRRVYALVPVLAGAVLNVLPIVLFPEVSFRFDYLSLTASAVLYALALDAAMEWAAARVSQRVVFTTAFVLVAVTVGAASVGVAQAAAAFGEYARVSRVPFRNIRQAHPTLPDGSLVYFVDPPIPGPNLSGMLFWYYGANVTTLTTDSARMAALREYPLAYVYYLDADGNQKEQRVEPAMEARATTAVPVDFSGVVRLQGFELANSRVPSDGAFVLLLYWRGLRRMETDYTVSVKLVDANNRVLASYEKAPHRGNAPTSTWIPGDLVVDAIPMPVPQPAPSGALYLQLQANDPGTGAPLQLDSGGDRLMIGPVSVAQ